MEASPRTANVTFALPDGLAPEVYPLGWRVPSDPPDGLDLPEGQRPVEALLADAAGVLSLYVGAIGSGRIDLATDLMAHTASGADMASATRMYGLVEGDLLWAWDLAAFGHELRSYASARLARATR